MILAFLNTFSKAILVNLFILLVISFLTPPDYSFSQDKITAEQITSKVLARIGGKEIIVEVLNLIKEGAVKPDV